MPAGREKIFLLENWQSPYETRTCSYKNNSKYVTTGRLEGRACG
jgi:hypothetical protein